MKNLIRFLKISVAASLLSACQAQYRTTDPNANQPANYGGYGKASPSPIPNPNQGRPPTSAPNPNPAPVKPLERPPVVQTQPMRRQPVPNRKEPPQNSKGPVVLKDEPKVAKNDRSGPVWGKNGGMDQKKEQTRTEVSPSVVRNGTEVGASGRSETGPCFCQEHTSIGSFLLTGKLDLLFVVDPSISSQKREEVGKNLERILEDVPQNFDVRVGVLPAHSSAGSLSGTLFAPVGEQKVLNSSPMEGFAAMSWSTIRNTFRERLANLPSEPAPKPNERGLFALNKAFNGLSEFQNIVQSGMIRRNAALAIVIVGKLEDEKGFDAAKLLARMKQFKGEMPLSINGIFSSGSSFKADQKGYGYLDLIDLEQGNAIDLNGNLENNLASISKNIFLNFFKELEFPNKNQVKYNGEPLKISFDGIRQPKGMGYFNQQTGKFHIHSMARENSRITIEFCKN